MIKDVIIDLILFFRFCISVRILFGCITGAKIAIVTTERLFIKIHPTKFQWAFATILLIAKTDINVIIIDKRHNQNDLA